MPRVSRTHQSRCNFQSHELHWTNIPWRLIQPLAIAKHLDVIQDCCPGRIMAAEVAMMHQFVFQITRNLLPLRCRRHYPWHSCSVAIRVRASSLDKPEPHKSALDRCGGSSRDQAEGCVCVARLVSVIRQCGREDGGAWADFTPVGKGN